MLKQFLILFIHISINIIKNIHNNNNNKSIDRLNPNNNIRHTQMRSYFKQIMSNVYDKVLYDDYIQPLEEKSLFKKLTEYQCANNMQVRSDGKGRRLSFGGLEQDASNKIQSLSIITPDREFRLLGRDPTLDRVNFRMKELKQISEQLSEIMLQNFPKYSYMINKSITQVDKLSGMQIANKKTAHLRVKLHLLENACKKSQNITFLQIKLKNIKSLLAILNEVPNLQKMSLIQLKTLTTSRKSLLNNEKLKNLKCLAGVSGYIQRVIASQLSAVIKVLEDCIVHKFQQQVYEDALKKFMIAQHSAIRYEKLFIKLVQKQLRRYASEMGTDIFQICQFYLKIIINLHSVFRWHREHEQEQTWQIRKYSQQKPMAEQKKSWQLGNIQVNILRVTKNVKQTLDECLKDSLQQNLHNPEYLSTFSETLYLILRISEIVQLFSGQKLNQSLKCIQDMRNKHYKKIKDKGFHELKEALEFQDRNQWNRLPIASDYSHTTIDKSMYQIHKHHQLPGYKKVHTLLTKFIKKQISKNTKKQQFNDEEDNQDQNWQIQEISLPVIQKFQKHQSQIRLKCPFQVIICQSALTALKYIQKLIQLNFYIPNIEQILTISDAYEDNNNQNKIMQLESCFYFIQYYIYYIFQAMLSSQLKANFYKTTNQVSGLQNKYHQRRIAYQFGNLHCFINYVNSHYGWKSTNIPNNNNNNIYSSHNITNGTKQRLNGQHPIHSNKEIPNTQTQRISLIKSRVVACQSTAYIYSYLQHMLKLTYIFTDKYHYHDTNKIQKFRNRLCNIGLIINQLTQLTYTDMIPKIFNLKATISLVDNIRWDDQSQDHLKQYSDILIQNSKEFYYKIKSLNRGEVTIQAAWRIFGLYWKTQLTTILKSVLCKNSSTKTTKYMTTGSKMKLETFIDQLYAALMPMLKQKQGTSQYEKVKEYMWVPYSKTKNVFGILLQTDWSNCCSQIQETITKYQYIFSIQISLASLTQCSLKGEQANAQAHKQQIINFIEQQVYNHKKCRDTYCYCSYKK